MTNYRVSPKGYQICSRRRALLRRPRNPKVMKKARCIIQRVVEAVAEKPRPLLKKATSFREVSRGATRLCNSASSRKPTLVIFVFVENNYAVEPEVH